MLQDAKSLRSSRVTEPIEDVHNVTQVLILSFMGKKALESRDALT